MLGCTELSGAAPLFHDLDLMTIDSNEASAAAALKAIGVTQTQASIESRT